MSNPGNDSRSSQSVSPRDAKSAERPDGKRQNGKRVWTWPENISVRAAGDEVCARLGVFVRYTPQKWGDDELREFLEKYFAAISPQTGVPVPKICASWCTKYNPIGTVGCFDEQARNYLLSVGEIPIKDIEDIVDRDKDSSIARLGDNNGDSMQFAPYRGQSRESKVCLFESSNCAEALRTDSEQLYTYLEYCRVNVTWPIGRSVDDVSDELLRSTLVVRVKNTPKKWDADSLRIYLRDYFYRFLCESGLPPPIIASVATPKPTTTPTDTPNSETSTAANTTTATTALIACHDDKSRDRLLSFKHIPLPSEWEDANRADGMGAFLRVEGWVEGSGAGGKVAKDWRDLMPPRFAVPAMVRAPVFAIDSKVTLARLDTVNKQRLCVTIKNIPDTWNAYQVDRFMEDYFTQLRRQYGFVPPRIRQTVKESPVRASTLCEDEVSRHRLLALRVLYLPDEELRHRNRKFPPFIVIEPYTDPDTVQATPPSQREEGELSQRHSGNGAGSSQESYACRHSREEGEEQEHREIAKLIDNGNGTEQTAKALADKDEDKDDNKKSGSSPKVSSNGDRVLVWPKKVAVRDVSDTHIRDRLCAILVNKPLGWDYLSVKQLLKSSLPTDIEIASVQAYRDKSFAVLACHDEASREKLLKLGRIPLSSETAGANERHGLATHAEFRPYSRDHVSSLAAPNKYTPNEHDDRDQRWYERLRPQQQQHQQQQRPSSGRGGSGRLFSPPSPPSPLARRRGSSRRSLSRSGSSRSPSRLRSRSRSLRRSRSRSRTPPKRRDTRGRGDRRSVTPLSDRRAVAVSGKGGSGGGGGDGNSPGFIGAKEAEQPYEEQLVAYLRTRQGPIRLVELDNAVPRPPNTKVDLYTFVRSKPHTFKLGGAGTIELAATKGSSNKENAPKQPRKRTADSGKPIDSGHTAKRGRGEGRETDQNHSNGNQDCVAKAQPNSVLANGYGRESGRVGELEREVAEWKKLADDRQKDIVKLTVKVEYLEQQLEKKENKIHELIAKGASASGGAVAAAVCNGVADVNAPAPSYTPPKTETT
ncbi:unnamed protein product [Vitrella brassicaformis CCMP3155]|uniref:Uncharacterized protein n=2 Tax=Vitrella brassicaformis TaxID=1169539 RepID=A0A0G4H240_VITBC|nr:unnamed protein product [Vitrella brassicaformis CCMP3155]|eukprot:CEM37599.1 unnamed protein product [Vitrella brassicaformis CCMP3155]